MLTRRRFLGNSALSSAMLAYPPLLSSAFSQTENKGGKPLRLAILGSVYTHQSALQTIADRFLVGYPHEGDWHMPNVQVVSLYIDQRIRKMEPEPSAYDLAMSGANSNRQHSSSATGLAQAAPETATNRTDLSEARAKQFGFRLCDNIQQALRVGGDRLAVDAILTILEDDDYPRNDKGQILLPAFDFFQQCVQVFESEGRAVPYFNHKSLSFSFQQAQMMVRTAERLKFPLLAGSSLPVTWRLPDIDIPLGAHVQEVVMIGVGSLDGADFDALEALQAMLERRKVGETGVKAVQMLEGNDVWVAASAGRWSKDLLSSALSRSDTPLGLSVLDGRPQDLTAEGILPQLVKDPAAYCIEYIDGTRATLLMLNGAIRDFNISVRVADHGMISTQFFTTPNPNQTYSACLAAKIEQMYETKTAPYPVERTLLTSGVLEACLTSRHRMNQRIETPHLSVSYYPPAESQYARA